MRQVGWLLVLVLGISCGGPRQEPPPPAAASGEPAGDPWAPKPDPPPQDYAIARRSFHTKLVRTGPAPQRFRPQIVPADTREIELDSGGLTLKAWISNPPASGHAPAVLFLHGGFAFDVTDWEMAKPFRDAGFVVMMPTLRGENGLPGAFTLFYDEVDDVLAAAEVLAKQPGVDASHLYVSGHSAGGVLTMLAVMTSRRFRAAAPLSGAPDASVFVDQPALTPFDPSIASEVRMRSPLVFAASFKCPTRMYVGEREAAFVASMRETARRAKAAGLDVEAEVVPGDHFSMPAAAIPLAIAFFQQH